MASVSLGLFVRQVRQEMSKVSWPSRRETLISVALVFILSMILGIYFLIVDKILAAGVALIFG
jgi:preprotein translocase subunit SecE